MPEQRLTRFVEECGEPRTEVTVERTLRGREAVEYVQRAQRDLPQPSRISRVMAAARAELDPSWRDARRLARDPNYRPVRAFTMEEAVSQGLLPPAAERLSQLDRLLSNAPDEQLDGNIPTPRSLPSLGDLGTTHDRLLGPG